MAHASYVENKLHEHRTRAGRSILCPIVLDNEGDEDEDDIARLSDLIALAEAGLQVEEAKDDTSKLSELIALAKASLQAKETEDDTGRLSELIALAEAGLQAKQVEEDTGRLSELIGLAEVGLQAEGDDDVFFTQAAAAADEAEASYYRRHVGQSNAGEPSHSNRVVVEDWYSNYVTPRCYAYI